MRRRVAGAVAALALAVPATAAAESAVWTDVLSRPGIDQTGRLFGVPLFNGALYTVPFYRITAGTSLPLFGQVFDEGFALSPGSEVRVYKQEAGQGSFVYVGATTSANSGDLLGVWTADVRPTRQTAYVAFALGDPNRASGTPLGVAISNPVIVSVAPRLRVRRTIRATATGVIHGTISPTATGKVTAYLLNGTRARKVATTTARSGAFSLRLRFKASGTYAFSLVFAPSSNAYVAGATEVTVVARVPVPAPPPPPPAVVASSVLPTTVTTTTSLSNQFGGSCNAFGCTGGHGAPNPVVAQLVATGAPVPASYLALP
jgi:hypothetical protein